MFVNAKLRALEIPEFVVATEHGDGWKPKRLLRYDFVDIDEDIKDVFEGNVGWRDGDSKVALYRVSGFAADGTVSSYAVDNRLKDGENYVYNPLILTLDMKDEKGNPLELDVQRTRKISGESDLVEHLKLSTTKDFTNFKIGGELEFTLPQREGYVVKNSTYLKVVDDKKNRYSINLSGDAIILQSYGDGYDVPYRVADLKIEYEKEVVKSEPISEIVIPESTEPEATPEPKLPPEVQLLPEADSEPTENNSEGEEIVELLSSGTAGNGRDTAVLPGMIPMKSSGAAAQGQNTAVDPGFIAGQASAPTASLVAGVNLPKTGEGLNADWNAILFFALGISLLSYGYYHSKKRC